MPSNHGLSLREKKTKKLCSRTLWNLSHVCAWPGLGWADGGTWSSCAHASTGFVLVSQWGSNGECALHSSSDPFPVWQALRRQYIKQYRKCKTSVLEPGNTLSPVPLLVWSWHGTGPLEKWIKETSPEENMGFHFHSSSLFCKHHILQIPCQ